MRTNKNRRDLINELKKSGKTQTEIAKELGCAKSTVSYYVGNKTLSADEICGCGSKKRRKAELCQACRSKQRRNVQQASGSDTLGSKTYTKHQYAKFAYVRYHARSLMIRDLKISICQNCGYDKHVEVCHIKPISSYSEDTKLDEINNVDNLVVLCPNCHWELDNGVLELSEVQRARIELASADLKDRCSSR